MGYKRKTIHFNIPVLTRGDVVSDSEELRRAQIIENQLIAANAGSPSCVFEEGSYRVRYDEDKDNFTVILHSTGASVALRGVVNGSLVQTENNVEWSDLDAGHEWHLYVRWTPKMFENPERFRPFASERVLPAANARVLYLAKVDLRGAVKKNLEMTLKNNTFVDRRPQGKVYKKDLSEHVGDETLHHKMFVVDVDSKGQRGVLVQVHKATCIISVDVHQRVCSGGFVGGLGALAVGYNGEDEDVTADNQCKIYNQGKAGVPLRAVIIYR